MGRVGGVDEEEGELVVADEGGDGLAAAQVDALTPGMARTMLAPRGLWPG